MGGHSIAGHGSAGFPLRTDKAMFPVHGRPRAASAGSRNLPIKRSLPKQWLQEPRTVTAYLRGHEVRVSW
jgi:hypothetical protein